MFDLPSLYRHAPRKWSLAITPTAIFIPSPAHYIYLASSLYFLVIREEEKHGNRYDWLDIRDLEMQRTNTSARNLAKQHQGKNKLSLLFVEKMHVGQA